MWSSHTYKGLSQGWLDLVNVGNSPYRSRYQSCQMDWWMLHLSVIYSVSPIPATWWFLLSHSGRTPISRSGALPNLAPPPTHPPDIALFWVSFIQPRMLGEMSLFHDRPTSLPLVLLVPGSHLMCISSLMQVPMFGVKVFSCFNIDLMIYSTLFYFTFCILPFIRDLLILLLCNDIIVFDSPIGLL